MTAPEEHTAQIVPRPKMDAPRLVAAVCSCGEYQSSAGTEKSARKAHAMHSRAKRAQQWSADQPLPED